MKKRFLSAMLSVAMAASLVTGCAGSSSGTADTKAEDVKADTKDNNGTEAGEKDTQAASGEPVTLTVMDGYAPEDPHGQYIYQYAEEFMKENPDIKVEIQAIASGDIYTKLAAMATSPDDLPTIFFTSADQIPTLYDLGLTEDLSKWMDKEVVDGLANGVMDACTIDGQMTYYPVAVQPQAVIYRIDRFEEAGLKVPSTWDEFVDCAKALTKDTDGDGQVDQWGFSMVGSNNSSGQSRFMSYLWSNGYELAYQEDGSGEWKTDITTDPAFVDVFSKWTDMNNVEGVVPTGITEVDYPTAANYFAMGYTSMFLTGPNALGVAYANNPELKGKLGSFKLPGEYSGTMLGAEGYAITAKSTDAEKAAAAKYLAFFTSHDQDMKFWESSGKIPSTTEGQKVSYITGDDYAGFLKQIEDGCRPTLPFAGISGLKSALGDAYASVFSNEKTNDQAVEQLVKDLEQLLEDYN
ncbi:MULTISPECIES: sugar ABC transporter substrate-binding protein [unclassified Clostridium]|uniref:ABC transporter substrate-binding protein n=1 Tax=unclassified Clostridium TaxID=2614128 RepID=UPI0011067582|nr:MULTISPECIES: sugar ABC transporter substrate-binding protein [unclassified Clostridium]